jgi:putative transcriptional regulator
MENQPKAKITTPGAPGGEKGASMTKSRAGDEKKPAPRLRIPPEIDVKSIRTKLSMSQEDFAAEFGFTTDQIKAWEQNRSRPQGGARVYLLIIEKNPKAVMDILREIAKNGTRRKNVA